MNLIIQTLLKQKYNLYESNPKPFDSWDLVDK